MTKTKIIKILKDLSDKNPDVVICKYFDYYKYKIEVLKYELHHRNTIPFMEGFYCFDLNIKKLYDFVINDNFSSSDIPNVLLNTDSIYAIEGMHADVLNKHLTEDKTIKDIARELYKNKRVFYKKIPVVIQSSLKEYNEFVEGFKLALQKI